MPVGRNWDNSANLPNNGYPVVGLV